jgi:hypothetical protein
VLDVTRLSIPKSATIGPPLAGVRAILAPVLKVLKDFTSRRYRRRLGGHEPALIPAVSSSLARACAGACFEARTDRWSEI